MKLVNIFILCICMVAGTPYLSYGLEFKDICRQEPGNPFCESVGKQVYNKFGHASLREKPFGKIIGVAWILSGEVIGKSPAMPEAGLVEDIRRSPVDAFYYIIKDDGGYVFVRQCNEIRPSD
jgi:hypothetical protein